MTASGPYWVDVPGGQVHCHRAGIGPAVLFLPEFPFSGDPEWLDTDLIRSHTLLVPDPLPTDLWGGCEQTSRAYVALLRAWHVEQVALVIPPSARKVASEIASLLPTTVRSGIRLPGPAEPSRQELAELGPRQDGTHLLRAWHRVRDTDLFSGPEQSRHQGGHPSLDRLARRTADLIRVARTAPTGSAAAPPGATEPWPALAESPSAIWPQACWGALESALATPPGSLPAPPVVQPVAGSVLSTHPGGITRTYLPTRLGRVRLRIEGDPAAPVLLFLHGSPGSAESFSPTLAALAEDYLVLAPDCPGNGGSTPHSQPRPALADLAEVLHQALSGLGTRAEISYGIHTGAGLALELADIDHRLTGTVVANGLTRFSREELDELDAHYFADITPSRHGSHLVTAWHLLRDVAMFWPWYGTEPGTVRAGSPPDPEVLQRLVGEFLASGPSYASGYRAAFHHDAAAALARLSGPATAVATPSDPLRATTIAACAETGRTFWDLASPAPQDVRALIARIRSAGPLSPARTTDSGSGTAQRARWPHSSVRQPGHHR